MTQFNGSHLINLFKELNIEIGHLNPAVIHGWFDTDCPDTKTFWNWMCSSLSKENYVSAQELQECNEIESCLEGEDYTEALNNLETNYPNILDVESNRLDIHVLEQEVALLEDEEEKTDKLIESQEKINKSLSKELYQAESDCHESSLNCKNAEAECIEKSKKLDRLNELQHENILTFSKHLYDFEVRTVSNFLNNADINERIDEFETLIKSLKIHLKDYETTEHVNLTSNSQCDEEISTIFTSMYERIYKAREKCLILKSEGDGLYGLLRYLLQFKSSKLPFTESTCTPEFDTEKKEHIESMIKKISTGLTDNSLNELRLQYAENELKVNEEAHLKLQSISKQLEKLLSHYYVVLALLKEESSAISSSDDFLRKIYFYISKNLHSSLKCSTNMTSVTEEFNKFMTTAKGTQKFKFAKYLINLIREDTSKECSLEECVKIVSTFKNNLKTKRKHILIDSLAPRKSEIFHSANVLRKFLTSGPTNRILIMPPLLDESLTTMVKKINSQNAAITWAVTLTKKTPLPKWETIRRQLWIYYLTDPEKLFSVIKELEQEKNEKNEKPMLTPHSNFRESSIFHSVSFLHK